MGIILLFPNYIFGYGNTTKHACEFVTCLKEGDPCNSGSLKLECEYGTFCPDVPHAFCTKYNDVGEACSTTNLCWPDLQCKPKSHKPVSICQNLGFLVAGEKCKESSECATENLICTHGVCALKSGVCQDQRECSYKHFCQSGRCIKRVKEGMLCHTKQDCKVGLVCSGGTCIKPFSLGEGEPCHYMFNYHSGGIPLVDCNIGDGLYCSFPSNKDIGICTKYNKTDGNCDNHNAKCQWMEQCICSHHQSKTRIGSCEKRINFGQDCQNSLEDLVKCAKKNHCSLALDYKDPSKKTCLYKHCGEKICSSPCFNKDLKFDEDTCGEKGSRPLQYACRESSSSIRVTPSIFLISLLFVYIL